MSKARRRYYRTILLGTAAMGLLVWSAVDQFGLSWGEMLSMFLTVLAGIAIIIAVAGVTVALWMGMRTLASRWRQ